jgi:hypothetical protein
MLLTIQDNKFTRLLGCLPVNKLFVASVSIRNPVDSGLLSALHLAVSRPLLEKSH